jgi:outer membrane protein assembly factor BamD (BamD/ComL family)
MAWLKIKFATWRPGFRACGSCLLLLASSPFASAQEIEFDLGSDDEWTTDQAINPSSESGQLLLARRAVIDGNTSRARDLATAFIDRYPNSMLQANAYLIKGDAYLEDGDEYKALFEYEEIARGFPSSPVFVTALEREFEIAKAYANGLRRKLLGTFRIVSTQDEAQELLIRIQERLPGSRLAEQAGMELADFYFRIRDLRMAAEAYDLFVENYPRSADVNKARLRLIYSYLADYRGPKYDASGLEEARLRLEDLRTREPGLAQRIGAKSLLVRIYESDARKMLVSAEWYLSINDPISAEVTIRRLVKQYPDSIASLEALREIPKILARMPETVVMNGPDYRTLRSEKLGVPWDQNIDLSGVSDPPVPMEAERPESSPQEPPAENPNSGANP